MSKSQLDESANRALNEFASRALVFLCPEDSKHLWVASGTPFVTQKGRVVVLTAKHNVEETRNEPLRVGFYKCSDSLHDVVAGIALHPGEVDVAAVVLKDKPSRRLREFALGPEVLGEDDHVDLETDAIMMAGFVRDLTKGKVVPRPGHVPRLEEVGVTSVTHGTFLQDPPKDSNGRLRVAWLVTLSQPDFPSTPGPEGISGGAVWRFRRPTESLVWSPSSTARLIGIPVASDAKATEFAESVMVWCDWFKDMLLTVDQDFPFDREDRDGAA